MIAALLIVVPGLLGVIAYLGLRLRRDRSELAQRRALNALIVPNLDGARFDPAETSTLPAPAARYLCHSIRPGTPLSRTVDLQLAGTVRAGPGDDWLAFEAQERISAGRGFVCRTRLEAWRNFAVEGADYLVGEDARSEFFLAGLLPLVRCRGADSLRSATGRLMLESLWLPGALLPSGGARWQHGDEHRSIVRLGDRPDAPALTITVGDDGALRLATMMRVRDGVGSASGLSPFGLRVDTEAAFDGYTIPVGVSASWGYGTDESFEFLKMQIHDARYF